MKKTLLIIGGVSTIVILFAIWLYLLIYGTPKPVADVFTNFNLFGTSTVPEDRVSIPELPPPEVVDVITNKLRQLTVRPVIGFQEYLAASSSPRRILYAESGTGHVFQINLETGEETRLSNTTVPNAQNAVFSPSQGYVAIRSGYQNSNEVVLVELNNSGSGQATTLAARMNDFSFSSNGELLYTELRSDGTAGIALNPKTKGIRSIFNLPFQTATIIWSRDGVTPHYVYPKASAKLYGYFYAIKNGTIVRQPAAGLGLIGSANSEYISYTTVPGKEPLSFIYNLSTEKPDLSPIITEPNKCAFGTQSNTTLYCGYSLTTYGYNFPDDWYKGTRSFADRIWKIDLADTTARQLVDPLSNVGRELDITGMQVSSDEKMLYFLNKNDTTLWTYEI